MAADLKAIAKKHEAYLIEMRRYFHQHPELSFKEIETGRKVRSELEAMGIECKAVPAGESFGIMGTIKGGHPGKTILLRADMDALPIVEETGAEYTSVNEGVMHACGHDCHIAILLASAKILCEIKEELCGDVRLLFQPAEEVGRGAGLLIKEGVLEGVDAAYASHVWATLPAGTIAVDPGAVMAAGSRFEIFVEGKSGHGAEPYKSIDPVITTAAIAMNLQSIVSREIDTQEPSVLTIGHMESGSAFNIVPATGYIDGTTRTWSREVDMAWGDMITRVAENTAAAYRAKAKVKYTYLLGPVVNDDAMTELVRGSVRKVGGEALLGHMKPTPVAEDFSEYQKKVPGVMAFVGVGNADCDAVWPQHSCHYKVDESALINGALVCAQVAIDFLNG